MGKLNEIQEQTTQSWGSNSFTTKITDQTVEFDSAKDSFTFMDEVNVPTLKVNGQASVAFTEEEKAKLAKVTTPMNMKGRVDSVADLPTENVAVGDTYLVGSEGSENFEEYVCTALEGSPATPVWENIGHIKVQPDWNQNDSNAEDFIKNRTHYAEYSYETLFDESVTYTIREQNVSGAMIESELEIVEGKTYKVTKDGEEVSVVAEIASGGAVPVLIYGNFAELVNGSWMIGVSDGYLVIQECSQNAVESASWKIEISNETVHTLDDKFLSNNIARVSDIASAQMPLISGAAYLIPGEYNRSYELDSNGYMLIDVSKVEAGKCLELSGTIDILEDTVIKAKDANGDNQVNITIHRNIASFTQYANYTFFGKFINRGNKWYEFNVAFFENKQ